MLRLVRPLQRVYCQVPRQNFFLCLKEELKAEEVVPSTQSTIAPVAPDVPLSLSSTESAQVESVTEAEAAAAIEEPAKPIVEMWEEVAEQRLFESGYVADSDAGNLLSALQPFNKYVQGTLFDKISCLSPFEIYNNMDVLSRDFLFYCSDTLSMGMGFGIAAVTLAIKLVYFPTTIKVMLDAEKMKLLEPETKNFEATIQRMQKMGDFKGVRDAQQEYERLREKHGLKTWPMLVEFSQVPVLITWFVSLRYVASMPDKYPELRTDGLLWFKDLAEMDPYCILPIMNSLLTYLNISLNPNMSEAAAGTAFGKYMPYVRYVSFFALPIVVFFPSALNLYWCLSSSTQLLVAILARSELLKEILQIPEYLPGTILDKLNQKKSNEFVKAVIQDSVMPKKIAESVAEDVLSKQDAIASEGIENAKLEEQREPPTPPEKDEQQEENQKGSAAKIELLERTPREAGEAAKENTVVYANKPPKKKTN